MKDTDARDEEENVHDGRKKKTNQVEDRKLTVREKQTKNQEDEEDMRSFMFRKSVRIVRKDDEELKNEEEMQKDELYDQTGKICKGARRKVSRKDEVRGLARMHSQERSPLGKVMKHKRGTPGKVGRVQSLKKVFETVISGASSPTTMGLVELLPQLCVRGGVTNPNLATTTGCAGLKLRFCANEPEGGTQTGPRQVGGTGLQASQDWLSQNRLGASGPTRGAEPKPDCEDG